MGYSRIITVFCVLLVCFLTALAVITDGSFDPIFIARTPSDAHDSLGASLSKLDVTVRIREESAVIDNVGGRKVLYFGLLPALPRMLLNRLFPSLYGMWTPLMCLAGYAASLIAFSIIALRSLRRNSLLTPMWRTGLACSVILGMGLGTPLFFLVSWASIWLEAMIWGVAFSLFGIWGITEYLERRSFRALLAISCSAALALHSRVTFGFPLYIILGLFSADIIIFEMRRCAARRIKDHGGIFFRECARITLTAIIVSLPALAGVAVQGWYNLKRYGSVFRMLSGFSVSGASEAPIYSLSNVPLSVLAYFHPFPSLTSTGTVLFHPISAAGFVGSWTQKLPGEALRLSLNVTGEPIGSFSLTTSWLVIACAAGLLFFGKYANRRLLGLAVAAVFAGQAFLMLSYYYLSLRFQAEFLPLGVLGLAMLLRWGDLALCLKRTACLLLSILVSIAMTAYSIHFMKGVPGVWL